ncbi:MAG: TldD/PmbA family protein [Candidatus Eiseniibacteriota bacterium]|nr:MAG: TldD/PmbA family protein [Candidatus Eisenbacteria bacterium]
MKDLALLAVDTAKAKGASYADARLIESRMEHIGTKNGKVGSYETSENTGFGVRVVAGGSWGFASSDDFSRESVQATAARAVETALASSKLQDKKLVLAPVKAHVATWNTPFEKDPFTVPLEEKLSFLFKVDEALRKVKGLAIAECSMGFEREKQLFASTEGSVIEQELLSSGAGMVALAVGEGDVQRRSFPSSEGHFASGGYEIVERLKLLENAERTAEEAVALLSADECPSGKKDIILDGAQLCLQIHESIGHPSELDRVLGTEANYAGTSYLKLDQHKKLRLGSEFVSIVADSTLPGGLATVGFDDEGVPAQKWNLVQDGLFVGYLTSRETADVCGDKNSRGCMRADGWNRIPLVRMTNIGLAPGTWTLDDLIADTKDGIFMLTNRSWSIDQMRYNFQFSTEIAWEIKNGKTGRMLKNPNYQGISTEFWNSCDAVCNDAHWFPWGIINCGKGQPGQIAKMSHGSAPARFRQVNVGVAK